MESALLLFVFVDERKHRIGGRANHAIVGEQIMEASVVGDERKVV